MVDLTGVRNPSGRTAQAIRHSQGLRSRLYHGSGHGMSLPPGFLCNLPVYPPQPTSDTPASARARGPSSCGEVSASFVVADRFCIPPFNHLTF
jgi:hypothetical protein